MLLPYLAHAASYTTNFDALAVPNLPTDASTTGQSAVSASDGTDNFLETSVVNNVATLQFDHELSTSTATFTFTGEFANTSNPSFSYIFPGIETQTNQKEYEVVLSRGTAETRGALWIQRGGGGSSGDLGGPTYVGTSGTTFTGNIKYTVSVNITTPSDSTRTFAVSVQRGSDSDWLKSDGTWTSGFQTALTVSDTSGILSNYGYMTMNLYSSAADDDHFYGFGFDNEQTTRFLRSTTTPVLAKGGTYDGWTADAFADPQVTRSCDNSQYVMQVSAWSIANSKWATLFFTSPHLKANTWTYVSGSLLAPTGSDYILGNGGIVCFKNSYYLTYNHYPNTGIGVAVTIASSSDLLTWHTIADPLISAEATDPSNDVNPVNGKLEIWYATAPGPDLISNRTVHMWDTSDGSNWTDEGDQNIPQVPNINADYGEPAVFYIGNTRYLSIDGGPQGGYRNMILFYSPNRDTNWTFTGMSLSPSLSNAWEAAEVFDNDVIVANDGDGHGIIPHDVYAGSDTHSETDNTDSSVGVTDLLSWPSGNIGNITKTVIHNGARTVFRGGVFFRP